MHQSLHEIDCGNRQNVACIDKETHDDCAKSHQGPQPKIGPLYELDPKVMTANDRLHPSNHHQSKVMKNVLHTMVKQKYIERDPDVPTKAWHIIPYLEPSRRRMFHEWCQFRKLRKQEWRVYAMADHQRQPISRINTTELHLLIDVCYNDTNIMVAWRSWWNTQCHPSFLQSEQHSRPKDPNLYLPHEKDGYWSVISFSCSNHINPWPRGIALN